MKQRLTGEQLDCAHSEEELESLRKEYQELLDAGLGNSHCWLDNEDEILKKIPLLDRDNIKGWKAIYSSDGGWLAAAKAINAIGIFLKEQGVKFGVGRYVHFHPEPCDIHTEKSTSAGSFQKPLIADDGVTCVGVETIDGTKYYGDKVVMAAGAWTPTLIDLEDQCCSKVGFPPRTAYG